MKTRKRIPTLWKWESIIVKVQLIYRNNVAFVTPIWSILTITLKAVIFAHFNIDVLFITIIASWYKEVATMIRHVTTVCFPATKASHSYLTVMLTTNIFITAVTISENAGDSRNFRLFIRSNALRNKDKRHHKNDAGNN